MLAANNDELQRLAALNDLSSQFFKGSGPDLSAMSANMIVPMTPHDMLLNGDLAPLFPELPEVAVPLRALAQAQLTPSYCLELADIPGSTGTGESTASSLAGNSSRKDPSSSVMFAQVQHTFLPTQAQEQKRQQQQLHRQASRLQSGPSNRMPAKTAMASCTFLTRMWASHRTL